VLRWLREQVCPELSFAQMSDLAATVPPGSDGLVCLPYLAGERSPIWDARAKGVFFGLDYTKTRAHLVRACMEAVAYALRHNLDTAGEAGAAPATLRAMGGAANSRVWTQIKADITGKRIVVPASDTATTWGAALLAGVGTGLYADFARAVDQTVTVRREHAPDAGLADVYARGYAAYRALYENLRDLMRKGDTP
jgi:xylulokinase